MRARYFVYTHSIDGIVFYVGSSFMRTKRRGAYRTWHERAYSKSDREKEWHDFVNGREVTVDIIGYYNTKEAVIDAEYSLINELLDKPYASLVNKLGSKPVFQFSLKGEFIKEWPTMALAACAIGIKRCSINDCCLRLNPKRMSVGGFLWSFEKTPPIYKKGLILQKKLDGTIVNKFATLREATNAIGVSSYTVIKGCLSGRYSHGYGFKWEYENDAYARSHGWKLSKFSEPAKNQRKAS